MGDPPKFSDSLKKGLVYCYTTSTVVMLGYILGVSFLRESPLTGHVFGHRSERFANWDGQWYIKIIEMGYDYDERTHSSVAFFPVFPLMGRMVSLATGLDPGYALLVAANLALAATFVLTHRYMSVRSVAEPAGVAAEYVLIALGFLPTTFFFRMAYSEAVFLLVSVGTLYAMERHWPDWSVALLAGLATATRPVGLAFVPALAVHLYGSSPRLARFARRFVLAIPLSCWGLAAYTTYLAARFGEPLAFLKTQVHWRERNPESFLQKLGALVSLEPIRCLFDPSLYAYWGKYEDNHFPLLSLHVADSFVFLMAIGCLIVGIVKRWLTSREATLMAFLLIIPYYTSGYETYMRSMARYASAALPLYIVLGLLLSRVRGPIVGCAIGICGFLLGTYTAFFAAWYKFM